MNKAGKKLLLVLCISLGIFSLTACGKKGDTAAEEEVKDWTAVDDKTPTKTYDPYPLLLEFYAEQSAAGWTDLQPSAMGMSNALTDSGKAWGYAIVDLDEDGTDEMVIGVNEDGRTLLVNVFSTDEEGVLETRFVSDGTELLGITEDGEWLLTDGSSTRALIPADDGEAEDTKAPAETAEEKPEKTRQWDEEAAKAAAEEEQQGEISWKTIELKAFQ